MKEELVRAAQLGISWVVVHPGAHMGEGEETGIRMAANAITEVLSSPETEGAGILIENTSGQGSCLGHDLHHLKAISDAVGNPARVGFCLDTCHLHTAGYDLHGKEAAKATLSAIGATLGFDRIFCIHANDAKTKRGSRVDRHAHIGCGTIGMAGLSTVIKHPAFAAVPKILELPETDEEGADMNRINLDRLAAMHD